MSGEPWTVVRVVDLSPSRRRLEYVFADGSKHSAVVDAELDTPEHHGRIADALRARRFVARTPDGPAERPAPAPSPWIEP